VLCRDEHVVSGFVQTVDLNVDEDTLMRLAPFYRSSLAETTTPSRLIYYDRFEIHPIKVHLCFASQCDLSILNIVIIGAPQDHSLAVCGFSNRTYIINSSSVNILQNNFKMLAFPFVCSLISQWGYFLTDCGKLYSWESTG
jgi:hypothetical protein